MYNVLYIVSSEWPNWNAAISWQLHVLMSWLLRVFLLFLLKIARCLDLHRLLFQNMIKAFWCFHLAKLLNDCLCHAQQWRVWNKICSICSIYILCSCSNKSCLLFTRCSFMSISSNLIGAFSFSMANFFRKKH